MEKSSQSKLTLGLFAVYLLVLIWIIVFKLQLSFETMPSFRGLNFVPFAGTVVKNGRLDYNEIILNIIIFIPFGLYLSMIKPHWSFWKRILPIAGTSLLFELSQFVFAIGATDITDLIGNTLGGAVGMGLYFIFCKILKEKAHKILNIFALIATISVLSLGMVAMRFITYRF